ncbi:LbetaH domain-containing protein [Glacieibacterium frigidum]|uniref:putative colanic acid biosynthesis acetyltransferase n=1 Tax=Glacieibacterium frigidum TaxID=2593303 RepID=UPI001A9C9747|nr:putative colanic acid biosynthesis acetyltransferase [Glacieibacterium frigidum]
MILSARNKAGRALWAVLYALLYRPSPRPLHGWRRFLLRCFGATIGPGAHPYPRARIWAPWQLTMGPGSALADDVYCYCVARITLGAFATVSQYSFLCSAGHDTGRLDGGHMPLVAAPITIGARAWVAADVFVGPGVTIGDEAVVGARSTVTRDVGAGEIVAGSPPRFIRMRGL